MRSARLSAEGCVRANRLKTLFCEKNDGEDQAGDGEVDGRTSDGDPEFLPRFGGTFQTRDAADGVHHDLDRPDAVVRADQGVAKFMQQNRDDQSQNEEGIASGRLIAAEADDDQENEQQNEGEVQPDGDTKQANGSDRARRHGGGRTAFLCQ